MPGVGLAALANDSTEELTLGQQPVPTAMVCYTFRGGTRDCVFCVWEETLSASCSSGRLGVWPCGSVQALGIIPRVLQAPCFVWTGARMTSVEHAAGMLQMCLGIIRAWLGLGWAGAWAFRENQALATKDGGRAGQVLTKNGPGPRTVTDPRRALYLQLQQTPAGYKYLLGSCCTSSHRNRSHNHSME